MKAVTCHANAEDQGDLGRDPLATAGVANGLFGRLAHTTKVSRGRTTALPSATCHPYMFISGTAIMDAPADARPIATPQRPVTVGTFAGKSRLTTLGMRTLPTAMPMPASVVPTKSHSDVPYERDKTPSMTIAVDTSRQRSSPKRRPSKPANGAINPNAKSGTAVIKPASVPDRFSAARSVSIMGPTAVMGARSVDASSRRARNVMPVPTAPAPLFKPVRAKRKPRSSN
ncbi:hypothetical protein BN2905_21480 [Achromobacter xylosoxidans]|nr:hypothetical protein BN2905_21480 [Achromobacter xylosoxidans]